MPEANTLPRSMRLRLFITIMGVLCLAGGGQASIIFRPGEKVKYVGPGEEEISGNAQQLYDKAQEAEKQGNMGRAIKAYTQLTERHSCSSSRATI